MKAINAGLLGAAFGFYAASPAWALSIADVPLFQSTVVSPNVMLLIDNSGSMNHITWHAGYSDRTAYPSVEYCSDWDNGRCDDWDVLVADETYYPSDMRRGSCADGYKIFRYGVNSSCMVVPDPVGSNQTRFKGNYLRYLVSQGIVASAVPTTYRMQVARNVSKSIVTNNAGIRFGLMSFNPNDNANGGIVSADAGTSVSTINSRIDQLASKTWTPLAEAYYEMTRYYRGISPYYSSSTFSKPVQYRCQKNFGVVVTDGLPTYDKRFPTNDPIGGADIPNWDGIGQGRPEGERYSDGPGGEEQNEGAYLYLDDIAKFAYDSDLITSGSDNSSVSFNDPDFLKQNLITYTVGFSVDNQMLQDAADYGGGEYYTASTADQLSQALSRAIQSIKERTSSAAAIATNSTRLDTDTLIYQARFNSGDWSGDLIAYRLNADGSVGSPSWRTSDSGLIPDATSRNVLTHNGSAGVNFLWANLSSTQQADLAAPTATDGPVIVNWLRGGSSGAVLSNAEALRTRTSVLGDIVNSDPVFIGAQNFGYTVPNTDSVADEPADSYQAYLDSKAASGFTKMVMVGANDGMVHGFNAETGREMFAYVPASIYKSRLTTPGATPGLRRLTKTDYTHKYYVDGSIGFGDVYVGGSWKTYAVGGLGAGGRGLYALNVTDANSVDSTDVLWEITAPDTANASNDWNDLGYTYGLPVIARTQNDQWVAIFGNGYDSNTGKAVLYVVNAATGALIKKIVADSQDTADDTGNGLSSPAVMVDANRRVTYVYAGDLKGNLWKFNLNSTTVSSWDVAEQTNGNPQYDVPLFVAKDNASPTPQRQPITSGLEIGAHSSQGGVMIYFGTGKYFETSDNTVGANPQKQTFYGIWDTHASGNLPNGWAITGRSALQQQSITFESSTYRAFSKATVSWTGNNSKRGWYMDLAPPGGTAQGERAVSMPLLRAGRIIFTTIIPSSDPCLAGGSSWLMELDAFTGGNLNYAVFDTNNDREFNSADKVSCGNTTCDPGGFKSGEGIIKTPGIVSAGDIEYKYSGGSSGNILVVKEKGAAKEGRMSWRQLR